MAHARYKNIVVGNGYILPMPGYNLEDCLDVLTADAEAGSEEALDILRKQPLTYLAMVSKSRLGVRLLGIPTGEIVISPAQYPARYSGSSWAHLEKQAETSVLAQLVIAALTRARITRDRIIVDRTKA